VRQALLIVGLGISFAFGIEGAETLDAVTLYTSFEHEPPRAIQQAIEDELAAIMSPIQAEIVWRSLERSTGNERQCLTRLAVVHFQGTCDTSGLTRYHGIQWTLGTTHVSEGEVLPFCNIYSDTIRAYVAAALIPLDQDSRSLVFGRAVARVLAHELYHVLGHSKGHSRNGLMQADYTAAQLTGPAFRFGPSEYQTLRSALAVPRSSGFDIRPAVPGMALFLESGCSGCHGAHLEGTPFGPPLDFTGKNLEPAALAIRLSSKATSMFRQARSLNAVWPVLDPEDIGALAGFLNTRTYQAQVQGLR